MNRVLSTTLLVILFFPVHISYLRPIGLSFVKADRNPYARAMTSAPPLSGSGIDLYSLGTPNGMKITLALEELKAAGSAVQYKEHKINFGANEQKEPWFLEINPNGRIPAMIDNDRKGVKVWESGSMLLYLAKYYDTAFAMHFSNEDEETEMINWIFFQMGGLGPMMGQAGWFLGAKEKSKLGATRYINESKRLLSVYEQQLDDKDYLVGAGKGKYSFADLTSFTWARFAPYSLGIPDLGEAGFPNVAKWVKRIEARPVVAKMTADDMLAGMKKKPNWEDDSRKRAAWVWEEDDHKKDEL